jgi:hypothetical protein
VPQGDEFVSSSLRNDCIGPKGKYSRLDCDEWPKDPRLACRSGVAFCKQAQFSFRYSEFRSPTIQTDNKHWKYQHRRLVNVFQSEKMDSHLRAELPLVD